MRPFTRGSQLSLGKPAPFRLASRALVAPDGSLPAPVHEIERGPHGPGTRRRPTHPPTNTGAPTTKAGPPQPQPQPRRHPHPGPQPALHPGRHAPCQPPLHPPPRQPPYHAEADVGAKVVAPSVVAATTTSANLRNMTISRVGADSIIRRGSEYAITNIILEEPIAVSRSRDERFQRSASDARRVF